MHLMEKPKPVEEQVRVCRAVAMIVAKALEKQPQARYQNADAMIRDLRRALRHPDGEFMQQRRMPMEDRPREAVQRIRAARTRKKGHSMRCV